MISDFRRMQEALQSLSLTLLGFSWHVRGFAKRAFAFLYLTSSKTSFNLLHDVNRSSLSLKAKRRSSFRLGNVKRGHKVLFKASSEKEPEDGMVREGEERLWNWLEEKFLLQMFSYVLFWQLCWKKQSSLTRKWIRLCGNLLLLWPDRGGPHM